MSNIGAHRWVFFAVAIPLLVLGSVVFGLLFPEAPVAVNLSCGLLIVVSGLAAVFDVWTYLAWEATQRYADRKRADAITPATLIAHDLPSMHPDAIKFLDKFANSTEWEVEPGTDSTDVDWVVIHGGRRVARVAFIEHVLDQSTDRNVMAKRRLSEGAYEFDPRKMMTDYDQYDALLGYWKIRMMVTDAFGNQSAQWMTGWSPDKVRSRMGLTQKPLEKLEEK